MQYMDGTCVDEDAIWGAGTTFCKGKFKLKGVGVEFSTKGEVVSFSTFKGNI